MSARPEIREEAGLRGKAMTLASIIALVALVVGALIAVGVDTNAGSSWTLVFGVIATVLAAVNIFGGFLVTQRMLAMYKKKD